MLKRTVALMLCILSVFTLLPAFSSAQTLSGWTSKVDYDNTDPNKYSIEIDLVNQIITVYEGQIGGRIVLQSLCTTGDAEHQTGAGTFRLFCGVRPVCAVLDAGSARNIHPFRNV